MVALGAGLLYGALAFAAGFVMGAARLLLVAPRLGETAAVALEAPAMLALCWWLARWSAACRAVPPTLAARAAMGGAGLAALLALELGLAVLGFGRTLAAFLAAYLTPAGLIGLGAQIAFALLPLIQLRCPAPLPPAPLPSAPLPSAPKEPDHASHPPL